MDERWRREIKGRIAKVEIGDSFALEDLLADVWEEISVEMGTSPQHVGRTFSKLVQEGEFPTVVEAGVRKSPRASMWRKVD